MIMEIKFIALQSIIIIPIIIITSAWICSVKQGLEGFYFFALTFVVFAIYQYLFYRRSVKSKYEQWKRDDEIKKHDEDRVDRKNSQKQ